ncbi:unnamed protein product [Kluyveromyces dobzhanskii CBS 2104]|uniref:WGS project CCBQ000000000 data, contig 00104 n=1 Tax=Kluyveromyces dobzhanskii CBS 2104 TaxID=1427455 RepID=A0A0A8L3X8_9SACH|nr:unnamed protein product [Kluyveromyces dobzhanskii CBS 2104]
MGRVSKTQILVTDLENEIFSEGWPRLLEETLFQKQFPDIVPEYYSPLPSLHRIVIIVRSEEEAVRVYRFLQTFVGENSKLATCKVYLTESLISKPRSRSFDDKNEKNAVNEALFAVSGGENCTESSDEAVNLAGTQSPSILSDGKKPVLKVDTACSSPLSGQHREGNTFISSPSSLSPNQPLSPTRVKLRDDQEEYFYMEPAPASAPTDSPDNIAASAGFASEFDGSLSTGSAEIPSDHFENQRLQELTVSDSNTASHPCSPSITITSMF